MCTPGQRPLTEKYGEAARCFEVAFFDHLRFRASIAVPFGGPMARKWRPRRNLLPIGTFAQELGNAPVTMTERYI
jgi:hypothetical protein